MTTCILRPRIPTVGRQAFPSPRFQSTTTPSGGTFRTEGNLHIYHERKILPYSQRQLYALVADVDAYRRFIPFVTTSDVFEHKGRGEIKDKAWLDDQGEEGEKHVLRHLMKIQVMGFDEQWRSEVTCEKWYKVQATSAPSSLFKTLNTTWTLTPAPSNVSHPTSTSSSLPKSDTPLSSPGLTESSSTAKTAEEPTMVSIDLAYQFSNPFYAAAASAAFQRVSHKIMGAFEKRCMETYGQGAR